MISCSPVAQWHANRSQKSGRWWGAAKNQHGPQSKTESANLKEGRGSVREPDCPAQHAPNSQQSKPDRYDRNQTAQPQPAQHQGIEGAQGRQEKRQRSDLWSQVQRSQRKAEQECQNQPPRKSPQKDQVTWVEDHGRQRCIAQSHQPNQKDQQRKPEGRQSQNVAVVPGHASSQEGPYEDGQRKQQGQLVE